MKKIIVLFVCMFLSFNAIACDKWKGELWTLGSNVKDYYNIYKDYKGGSMDKAMFTMKSEMIVSELNDLKDYTNGTSSCSNDSGKYESRKETLLNYINYSINVMRAGNLIKLFR